MDQKKLVERCGSVLVPLYPTDIKGYSGYTVSWYEGGRRRRKFIRDLAGAREFARIAASRIAKQQAEALNVSSQDALMLASCKLKLRPLAVGLNAAVEEYLAARKLLGTYPMLEALRFWKTHHGGNLTDTPPEVVTEFVSAQERDGVSARHVRESKRFLGHVAARFKMNISEVTAPMLDEFLRSMSCGACTRNTYRTRLIGLFNYARRSGYLPDRTTPADATVRAKEQAKEIQIYKPEELELLLEHSTTALRPFVVLCAFCGLRAAEARRLEWTEVHLERGFIEVKASKSKTASRRLAPVPDNARAWLTPHQKPAGLVVQIVEVMNALIRLENAVNRSLRAKRKRPMTMHRNGLHHSFVSYRLASTQNVAQTALEAGHDAKILFKHYRQLVTPEDATRYFGIRPRTGN